MAAQTGRFTSTGKRADHAKKRSAKQRPLKSDVAGISDSWGRLNRRRMERRRASLPVLFKAPGRPPSDSRPSNIEGVARQAALRF
jgi:hypothetical protein